MPSKRLQLKKAAVFYCNIMQLFCPTLENSLSLSQRAARSA